jgi:hypothetical protein
MTYYCDDCRRSTTGACVRHTKPLVFSTGGNAGSAPLTDAQAALAAAAQDHETSGIHGPLHCSLACGSSLLAALPPGWRLVGPDEGVITRDECAESLIEAVRAVEGTACTPEERATLDALARLTDAIAWSLEGGPDESNVKVWNSQGLEGSGPTLAAAIEAALEGER